MREALALSPDEALFLYRGTTILNGNSPVGRYFQPGPVGDVSVLELVASTMDLYGGGLHCT